VVRNEYTADLDLAETFADLAGVPPLSFSDGRSLKPLLGARPRPPGGRRSSWRSSEPASSIHRTRSRSTREPPDKADLATVVPIPSYYGFQAPGYKYVEYKSGEKELYVASDPYELTSVANKVSPAIAGALART